MKAEKKDVIVFFQNIPSNDTEKYNKAFELYRNSNGKNLGIERTLNRGFSPTSLNTVLYELKKVHRISDVELSQIEAKPIDEELMQETNANVLVPINETIKEFIEVIASVPEAQKAGIKFRDEFNFLGKEDTPEALKALVTDKFTAYYDFADAHKELLDKVALSAEPNLTEDEIFELAKKAVDNFVMDQLIYDELLHYKETGKILGKHPNLAPEKAKNELLDTPLEDIPKKISNLENYIRRSTNAAEKAKTPEKKQKFLDKVVQWNADLEVLKEKLKASAEK